jgi:transcriptional regulator with XRE-family HTH domain
MNMRKQEAIALFGGTTKAMAEALKLTSSAVSQWPEDLRPEQVDRVIGAAVRLGLWREFRKAPQEAA